MADVDSLDEVGSRLVVAGVPALQYHTCLTGICRDF